MFNSNIDLFGDEVTVEIKQRVMNRLIRVYDIPNKNTDISNWKAADVEKLGVLLQYAYANNMTEIKWTHNIL